MKKVNNDFKTAKMDRERGHTPLSRMILGLLFIAAGGLLLAYKTGAITDEWFFLLFNWQTLLIGLGFMQLAKKGSRVSGFVLIFIGGMMLAPKIMDIPVDIRSLFLPVALIGIGLIVLFKGLGARRKKSPWHFEEQGISDRDYVKGHHVFSGGEYHFTSQNFQGGTISAIFGGGKYDFRNARLAPGDNVLEVNMVFGGIELLVPAHWEIKVEVNSIVGGFNSKFAGIPKEADPEDGRLIITGSAVFGGGEIIRY